MNGASPAAPSDAATLRANVQRLLAARERYLAHRPVRSVVDTLDEVAARWLAPASAWFRRAEEMLAAHFSLPVVRAGLVELFSQLRAEALWDLLTAELGDPLVLDEFRPRPRGGGLARAVGPRLAVHVLAGNIPNIGPWSVAFGLLAKAANLCKTAAEDAGLLPLFVTSLAEVDPELAACVEVAYWPSDHPDAMQAALDKAEAVIAYGSDQAVQGVLKAVAHWAPKARFLGYGHRVSLGLVAREHLTPELGRAAAAGFAEDVALYDQQGCLSPHVIYVEEAGPCSPLAWAAELAEAMAATERRLPRGAAGRRAAAAVVQLRGEWELRELAGEGVTLWASSGDTAWTVLYSPEPSFSLSCLGRTLWVKPVADLTAVPELLARETALAGCWQGAAVAAPPRRLADLAEALAQLGFSRICRPGSLQRPPLSWHHDGRPNVADLVRWTDWEVS